MHSFEELQEIFNTELRQLRFERQPKELYEPFDYLIGLGGKRIRPVLLLMACEMFGKDAGSAMNQAIAIELFHNFSLIHDDIMDEATLRRGKPTVHEKFNQSVAILSGDVMLVYAYEYLIKTEPELISSLLKEFNACAIKVCEGQQMDMNFENRMDVEVDDYLQMIELKTAELLSASLKIGAIAGGASEADANHLFEFGKELGLAFQLKDDWLDAYGVAEKFGKQSGGDILQNKKTFLYLSAIEMAGEKEKKELSILYSEKTNSQENKVQKALQMFNDLGIKEYTNIQIQIHYANALSHVESVSISEESKKPLIDIAKRLMQREY